MSTEPIQKTHAGGIPQNHLPANKKIRDKPPQRWNAVSKGIITFNFLGGLVLGSYLFLSSVLLFQQDRIAYALSFVFAGIVLTFLPPVFMAVFLNWWHRPKPPSTSESQ